MTTAPHGDAHRAAVLTTLLLAWAPAMAQQPVAGTPQATATPATPPAADAGISTLPAVRAVLEEDQPQPLDLDRFRNPVPPAPNAFDRAWRPTPSIKQVSEDPRHPGYVNYGIAMGIQATGKALKKLPGVKDQVQAAVARPPPLDAAQSRRAAALCAADPACGGSGD